MEVSPKGSKWWRLKYRFAGKEKRISLGVYPEVSLKLARERKLKARSQLANGIDPSEARKVKAGVMENANSFESVAREWFAKNITTWTADYAKQIMRRLERDLFPWLGRRPIPDISPPELLKVLRRVEDRGAIETAHRALQKCGQIFRYAIATGKAERDVSSDLRGALAPAKSRHYPTILNPKAVGGLLRSIDDYEGAHITKCALQFAPLVFVRPGELRHAEWKEVDFNSAEWRIPKEKMKARKPHVVPLSHQAINVLKELKPFTGSGKYVFPSVRSANRPMSENTVNAALRRLGYLKTEITGHSFRSMASTLLNEQGWRRDAIERQLAHVERNKVRAAYNHAEYLVERKKMMQAWADYLDDLKGGALIV